MQALRNQIQGGIMEILNGKVYKHFKGGYVLVISTAKHSDREEIEVVYKGLNNGKIYARPMESFVEIVKGANGDCSRFELATDEEVEKWEKKIELTYSQIETILGSPLPPTAYNIPLSYWANTETHSYAKGSWLAVGYKAKVSGPQKVIFARNVF